MDKKESRSAWDFDRIIRVSCDYQRTLLNGLIDSVTAPGKEQKTLLEGMTDLITTAFRGVSEDAPKLISRQLELMEDQIRLCQNTLLKLLGEDPDPVIRPGLNDRRFQDPAWQENLLFDFIKQSYLLNSRTLISSVNDVGGLDDLARKRLQYYARQVVSALAPTNFAATNPEVLRKAVETRGENLLKGMQQLLEDKERSTNMLSIAMTDPHAFEVGRNLACTPGKVVAQNRVMQLIQYSPTTEAVHRKPLLIVPSWVNKFYILDLSEQNSFVKWAVDQGFTVFMLSWVNPDSSHADLGFEDYMQQGILAALDHIEALTGQRKVIAMGYCLGGILLACTLAWMAKRGDDRIAAVTYLTTSLDFSDPGEMQIFMDEKFVNTLELQMEEVGYLDGRTLAVGFALLKENELYWNYYVQNYLKGERPSAFDLLYWNTDNANVPVDVHTFVMRDLHMQNGLATPGQVTLLGESLDLGDITVPVYFLATERDHIAKWQSCFAGMTLHKGPSRFVLAGSGHIAGVINPPAQNKYYYYVNSKQDPDPAHWLDGAFKHDGSWWPDWLRWAAHEAGPLVKARRIKAKAVIEDAPGSYVKRHIGDITPEPAVHHAA